MESRRAVVLVSNDLSHPALRDQQYAFSWRINRLRPLVKRGYTLVVVAAGGRVGPGGRPSLSGLRPRVSGSEGEVVVSPPILRLPMLWLLQSLFVTPLSVFIYCRAHRLKVEAVVASAVPYGAVGRFLNRILRTVLVVDYGDPDYARERGLSLRVLRFLEGYVLGKKGVDVVTCIDPNIKEYVRRYGRTDAVFLPPGGYWKGEETPKLGMEDPTEVVYAGHVAAPPAYRLDLLMEAIPKVLAKNPGAHFVVLGAGGYLGTLRKRAKDLGVGDRVMLPGGVPYAASKLAIARAGVAVQVLSDMCLGTKVMDYLSQGKAVVSCGSFYASYHEFLESGQNCLLVPPDADKLAEAISSVLSDRSLRNRLEANALMAVSGYDWDSQADKVLGLISRASASPQRRG